MTMRLAATGEVVGLTEPQMLAVANALSSLGIEAQAGGSAISKLMKQMEVSVKTYGTARAIIDSTGMSLRDLELYASSESKGFKYLADDLGLTTTELKNYMNQAKGLEAFANVANMSAEQFIEAWGNDAVIALDAFVTGLSDAERLGKSSIEVLDEMGLKEIRLSNATLALSTSNGILTKSVEMANKAWEDNTALAKEAGQRYETMESKIAIMKNGLNDLGLTMYESLEEPLKNVVEKATGYIQQLGTALKEDGLEGLVQTAGLIVADIITEITDALPSLIETSISIMNTIGGALKDNLPVITAAATDIILMLVDTFIDNLPGIIDAGIEILGSLAKGIMDRLPDIMDSALRIIMTLVKALIDNLPEIIQASIEIIISLVQGITEALPELIPAAVDAILTIVEGLLDNLDLLVDCAIDLILALIFGLMDAIPLLIEKAPVIITKLVEGIIKSLPKILDAGWKVLVEFIKGVISAIPQLLKAAGDIVKELWDAIKNTDWLKLGKDILDGIVNGLKNAVKSIGDTIKGVGQSIMDGFKGFFGIKSPSKLMAELIGKPMADGIGVGFNKEMKAVNKEMQKAINTDYTLAVNTALKHTNTPTTGIQNYDLTIPIDIGGNKFAKVVSRLQYDVNQGKLRVAGVSV